ncbi:MAG: diphthine--ammonia ligase [Sporocytophaga sp.]|nr:diphthine--ammonia ligase [Sporocytophaga sp.]
MQKAVFCWSGGKDSAFALYRALSSGEFEILALLTTINSAYSRVSMHGVREDLMDLQAEHIGIPLYKVYIPEVCTNEEYEKQMEEAMLFWKEKGVSHVIFGDIFLEDLKRYREEKLEKVGMKAVFPLWMENTAELLSSFLGLGFKTMICSGSCKNINEELVGETLSEELVGLMAPGTDPCGENGEFHTFVYEGPVFRDKLDVACTEKVVKYYKIKKETEGKIEEEEVGYWFADIKLKE